MTLRDEKAQHTQYARHTRWIGERDTAGARFELEGRAAARTGDRRKVNEGAGRMRRGRLEQ